MSKKIALVTSGIVVILTFALVIEVIASAFDSLDLKLEEDLGDDWED